MLEYTIINIIPNVTLHYKYIHQLINKVFKEHLVIDYLLFLCYVSVDLLLICLCHLRRSSYYYINLAFIPFKSCSRYFPFPLPDTD